MSIYNELFEWQKKIVDKYHNRSSFGLWLDMGLGKTPLSLAMAEKNHCNKIIVVTLKSKALEDEKVKGSFKWWNSKRDDKTDILVTNYEGLYKHNSSTLELKDDIIKFINGCVCANVAIILDESHYLKSSNSLRTKAVKMLKLKLKVKTSCVYTYLLTGTPFTIGYIDLYSQLVILGLELSKTKFIDNFCIRGRIRGLYEWQQPIVGYKNIDELFNLVHKYAITIKSDEVINTLPTQTFINITLTESDTFKLLTREKISSKVINKFEGNKDDKNVTLVTNMYYRDIDYPQSRWLSDTTANYWLRCRQMSIGFQGNKDEFKWFDKSRLERLKTFLTENEDNYIIFYNYTPELLMLYEILEELKYNIDVYCGEIKSLKYYEKYQKMSKEEKLNNHKNVILSNFASGSTGMNWQEYSKCIMFSLPIYDDYAQSIKRIHRIGQDKPCLYYIFSQDNFLDKGMIDSLNKRQDYTDKQFESDLKRVQELTK